MLITFPKNTWLLWEFKSLNYFEHPVTKQLYPIEGLLQARDLGEALEQIRHLNRVDGGKFNFVLKLVVTLGKGMEFRSLVYSQWNRCLTTLPPTWWVDKSVRNN